jgi:hypothetical protein
MPRICCITCTSFLIVALTAPLAAQARKSGPLHVITTSRTLDYTVQNYGLSGSQTFTWGSSAQGIEFIEVKDEQGRIVVRLDRARIAALQARMETTGARRLSPSLQPARGLRLKAPASRSTVAPRSSTSMPCPPDPFGPLDVHVPTINSGQIHVTGTWR